MTKRYVATVTGDGYIVRIKRNTVTCYCPAYAFPHRLGGGACHEDERCEHGFYRPDSVEYDPETDHCVECTRNDYIDIKFLDEQEQKNG